MRQRVNWTERFLEHTLPNVISWSVIGAPTSQFRSTNLVTVFQWRSAHIHFRGNRSVIAEAQMW